MTSLTGHVERTGPASFILSHPPPTLPLPLRRHRQIRSRASRDGAPGQRQCQRGRCTQRHQAQQRHRRPKQHRRLGRKRRWQWQCKVWGTTGGPKLRCSRGEWLPDGPPWGRGRRDAAREQDAAVEGGAFCGAGQQAAGAEDAADEREHQQRSATLARHALSCGFVRYGWTLGRGTACTQTQNKT